MTDKTSLGDRMKDLEGRPQGSRVLPLVPVIARLDGRAFHSFTKGLHRPYDERLHSLMRETTRFLVEETNARLGYTQSDEISLVWYSDDPKSQIFMDGKVSKMTSLLAAMATAEFNRHLPTYLPEKAERVALCYLATPVFDCRVFVVPTQTEAANCILWRVMDATRNSIQMAGQANFSHKTLHGKSCDEIQEMLHSQKGINWSRDYPKWAKEGSFFQRRTITRAFTATEIERLPAKHEARTNPGLTVERSEVKLLDMPPFGRVLNRNAVIFDGIGPILACNLDNPSDQAKLAQMLCNPEAVAQEMTRPVLAQAKDALANPPSLFPGTT